MNQLRVIHPYLWNGIWVFDDPAVGLDKEALVAGMPEIIALATKEAGIENPQKGFNIIFSHEPFPGHHVKLNKVGTEDGGTWYEWTERNGMKGWLCPALFKYFESAPETLYCQAVRSE